MEIQKVTGFRGSPIKKVDAAVDGHNYYIINAEDAKGVANVHILDFYSGLARFSPVTTVSGAESVGRVDGFFFVRNAADYAVKGDGKGDSTVHEGWAMYIWDPADYVKRKPITNAGWVKIAQQGDVDWDINDELKASFVLKTVYNAYVNATDNRFTRDESIMKQLGNRLVKIENNWDVGVNVLGKAHEHSNKTVLDELSDQFSFLYYKGRPISGNSYVYDHVEYNTVSGSKEIVWVDPTGDGTGEHEVVKNSSEIARRFLDTDLARVGLSLFVMEVDGSLTIYKFVYSDEFITPYKYEEANRRSFNPYQWPLADTRNLTIYTKFFSKSILDSEWVYIGSLMTPPVQNIISIGRGNPGEIPAGEPAYSYIEPTKKLTFKFAQTIVLDNHGVPEYVETLPAATKWHYGRGCWVPLQDDGEHAVGHLHECIEEPAYEGAYVDASLEDYSSSTPYYQENASGVIVRTTSILTSLRRTGAATTKEFICPADTQPNGKPILRVGDPTVQIGYKYRWVDINESGASIVATGSEFVLAYAEDTTLWKSNHIYWRDPEDTVTTAGVPAKWGKTTLVRKYGSEPANINDGTVICVTTDKNKYLETDFVDVIPYTNEQVYYKLFSTSKTGNSFAPTDAITVEKLDWAKIMSVIRSGKASMLFEVGSEIVLPHHEVYGDIVCEVVAINKNNDNSDCNGILVVTKDVLCKKAMDAPEGRISAVTGDANPEWTGDATASPRGSNGKVVGGSHAVGNLNIHAWLRSYDASTWWFATTEWDEEPLAPELGYVDDEGVMENGFMRGFPIEYRSTARPEYMNIFKTLEGVSSEDGKSNVGPASVMLPMYGAFYFDNITAYKQLGRDKKSVEWATYTGTPSAVEETGSRINYGFKTVKVDDEGNVITGSIAPEVPVGIVPMFLIG